MTTDLALAWATRPGDADPTWWARRLTVVRGFARHLHAFDPHTEVPPAGLLAHHTCRAVPYLYSDAEIAALMAAAGALVSPLRAATFETLIGLLVVTGTRVGEVIRLDRDDVDTDEGLAIIRQSTFKKSRMVPLHPSTLDALRAYAQVRDELMATRHTPSFFVTTMGTRLSCSSVQGTFSRLTHHAGLEPRLQRCRPRLHDFRHSRAVRTLIGWYRTDVDVDAHLPLLSTFLGHVKPANTYWYLSAVPELLALAAARRDHVQGKRP